MRVMRRNSLYLIIILFLAVTNIATVVSVRSKADKIDKEELPLIEKPQVERMSFFWGELGLSSDQEEDIADFNTEYNETAGEIATELSDLRNEIVTEISKENPDEDYLESVIAKFGEYHADLKRTTVGFYNQLSSVCTDEQRGRLEFMFRDMLDPDGVVYGRGRGGQGRGVYNNSQSRGRGREQGWGQGQGRGRGRNNSY